MDIKKKIGFLVYQASLMKIYTPILMEAINRGIEIVLFCGPERGDLFKQVPSYGLAKENLGVPDSGLIKMIYWNNFEELPRLVGEGAITDIIMLGFYDKSFENLILQLKKNNKNIHCVQWYGDYLITSPESLGCIGKVFVHSENMIDLYFKGHNITSSSKILREKFVTVGNPLFDCLPLVKTREIEIRNRYNLPLKKDFVLLMTQHLPFFEKSGRLRLGAKCLLKGKIKDGLEVFLGPSYKSIIHNIKDWCRKNGLLLVVKSRSKHEEPDFVKEAADFFITDGNHWYPTTTVELLSQAKLMISVWSAAVIESAACGVYNITIKPPAASMPGPSISHDYYLNQELFNCPGLSHPCPYDKLKDFLSRHKLSDFKIDEVARQRYLTKFAGSQDGRAAERIVDYILEH